MLAPRVITQDKPTMGDSQSQVSRKQVTGGITGPNPEPIKDTRDEQTRMRRATMRSQVQGLLALWRCDHHRMSQWKRAKRNDCVG